MLSSLVPCNVQRERQRFFASGCTYNPQFRYKNPELSDFYLNKFSFSCSWFAEAQKVLDYCKEKYGVGDEYRDKVWGDVLTREEVDQEVEMYLRSHGVHHLVTVKWSPTSLVTSFGKGVLTLVASPKYYRRYRLQSLLDHEIGTHFLRAHNQNTGIRIAAGKRAEPSKKKRSKLLKLPWRRFGWALATEEGLASLNTHQFYSDKVLWQPALNYFAVCHGATKSFTQLFAILQCYVSDREQCWLQCMRAKRGMTDTSSPGVFSKDLASFDGAMRILQQRKMINFNELHSCRVSLEEYERTKPKELLSSMFVKGMVKPRFLRDHALYSERLDDIARHNLVR